MTGAQIEVVEPGLAVALQDRGRFGWRRLGVPISGALDPALLAIANALAGGLQETDSAAFEVLLQGPTLAVRAGRVRFALAGPIAAVVERADGSKHDVPAWSTATLSAGDVIRIGAIAAAPHQHRWTQRQISRSHWPWPTSPSAAACRCRRCSTAARPMHARH